MAARRKVQVVKKKARPRPLGVRTERAPMRASVLCHLERQCGSHRKNPAAEQLLARGGKEEG